MKRRNRIVSAMLAASMCGSLVGALPVSVFAEDAEPANVLQLGTYEVETFEGVDQVWTSIYENQIPGYSGEGFAYLTNATLTAYVEVEEEGMYQVDVRAAQILSEPGGSRQQTIAINDINYTYNMPYANEWTDMTFGVFRFKKGINKVELKPLYGYGAYETMTISKAVLPELKGSAIPCDPKATPEAKSLLAYLNSVYGKHVLTGQQEIYGGGHGVQTSIRYDATADKCVDENGKEYTIVPGDYGEAGDGSKFPWHCVDENGQDYVYNTQNRVYGYNDYEQECRYLYETTGKYPAIRGFDLNCHNPGFAWEDGVADRMIDWATKRNGIVTISWHCTVPTSMADFEIDKDGNITKISNDWQKFTYSEKTDFSPANVMIEGTKENVFYNEAIKLAAAELQKLQDAGVPVLFRPLHEAEGNQGQKPGDGSGAWFWWAKEGAEVYNQLWKYLYDKLTNEYGLHNLIWEQNLYAWSDDSALWYTGDDYVDIVGFDKYNSQYNRHDGKTSGPNFDSESKIFWSQVGYVDNKKMVSMPENDCIPSVENMEVEQAYWLYFCTWYDGESGAPQFISGDAYQDVDNVKSVYNSDLCITLDELPADLYSNGGTVTPTEATYKPTEATDKPTDKPTEPDPTGITFGDVDESGVVDIMDVIAINKSLLGGLTLSNAGRANADVDTSGVVDTTDALNILKAVVKLVTLPVKGE